MTTTYDEPSIPMDSSIQAALLRELREPFPEHAVGKLPRVTCKDCRESRTKACEKHPKKECRECGNWMTTAHMHLDYVGHAAVTDRLLRADPGWTWEPVAFGPDGLPAVTIGKEEAELWIRLTVCGVTRLGVGTCPAGTFERSKQLIGDAIRNAAMRFGVALDLWSKEELTPPEDKPAPQAPAPPPERVAGKTAEAMLAALNDVVDDLRRTHFKQAFKEQFGLPLEVAQSREVDAWRWLQAELEVADHPFDDGADGICSACGTIEPAPWHKAAPGTEEPEVGYAAPDSPEAHHDDHSGQSGEAIAIAPEWDSLTAEWVGHANKTDLVAALTAHALGTEGTVPLLRSRLVSALRLG